ncbi:hypothetical protein ETAA8_58270 [Anatilimnocola aggregata]|uniref:Uncharacterized protein n=1 Tax=Anatilimnocola aggregata TaxID=2528021 RepID=A0A517YKD8_9BACT|nr:hypothetical protein ETAA8_58270 [Anatilimnocola aggregata]
MEKRLATPPVGNHNRENGQHDKAAPLSTRTCDPAVNSPGSHMLKKSFISPGRLASDRGQLILNC